MTKVEKSRRQIVQEIINRPHPYITPAELENYTRTNRSIHALHKLNRGTILTEKNCALLRTEKILRPGIHPLYYNEVLGKKIKSDIPDGEGIRWKDLL